MLMQLYFTHLCWPPFDSNLMTKLWRNLEAANRFTDVFYEYMRLVEMAFIHILKFVDDECVFSALTFPKNLLQNDLDKAYS
jgi:hypothetical protein